VQRALHWTRTWKNHCKAIAELTNRKWALSGGAKRLEAKMGIGWIVFAIVALIFGLAIAVTAIESKLDAILDELKQNRETIEEASASIVSAVEAGARSSWDPYRDHRDQP
jgi:hypothetical protein